MVLCTNLNLKERNLIDSRSKLRVIKPSFLMEGKPIIDENITPRRAKKDEETFYKNREYLRRFIRSL